MNQDQQLDGRLGEGTKVKGTLSFEDTVRIDGSFEGEIDSPATLILGPNAEVDASIRVAQLVVHGRLEGNVEATERTVIRATGNVEADIVTGKLSIETGATFNGRCDMPDGGGKAATTAKEKEAAATAKEKKVSSRAAGAATKPGGKGKAVTGTGGSAKGSGSRTASKDASASGPGGDAKRSGAEEKDGGEETPTAAGQDEADSG